MSNQSAWYYVNLVPILIYVGLESLFAFPVYFYPISGAILLVSVMLTFLVAKKTTIKSEWWNFGLLPLTTYISTTAYSVLVTNQNMVHGLLILSTLFVWLYFRTYFYFLRKPSRYKLASIENSASYLNFYNFFLLSSSLYGYQSFLSLKDWQFILIVGVYAFVVFYQLLWVLKLQLSSAYKYILLGTVVIIQIALAVSFLPFEYNVSGLLLALCYYVISSLIKLKVTNTLTSDRIKYYLVFSTIVFSIIFLTVRWL